MGIGAVPGILSLYFRITMTETEKYLQSLSNENEKKETLWKSIISHLKATGRSIRPHFRWLVGTAGTWFLFDIVFYANGLFSATVVELFDVGEQSTGPSEGAISEIDSLLNVAQFNIYLALMALPGYWTGVFLIELPGFGRKRTQIYGFILLAISYTVIGLVYSYLESRPGIFIALYGLTFFFCNAGPNTTTFVLPSETFPTESRATCHGISAASGKLGAVVGKCYNLFLY